MFVASPGPITDEDFIGKKFNRLTVIKKTDKKNNDGKYLFLYQCDCGNYILSTKHQVTSGRTKSCGCLKKDVEKERSEYFKKLDSEYVNKEINGLKVLESLGHLNGNRQSVVWKLRCRCGKEFTANKSDILSGSTKSCGCYNRNRILEMNKNKRKEVSVGDVFGDLVVIEVLPSTSAKDAAYICRCTLCGDDKVYVKHNNLISNSTTRCKKCSDAAIGKANSTHGMTNTRLYRKYRSIKSRCYREDNKDYINYGGRGIRMCDEWKNSFIEFYNWAMSTGYVDGLSIDRIDPDKNYCPENCRWVTMKEQSWNKQNTLRFADGTSIAEFCDVYKLDRKKLVYDNPDIFDMTRDEAFNEFVFSKVTGYRSY